MYKDIVDVIEDSSSMDDTSAIEIIDDDDMILDEETYEDSLEPIRSLAEKIMLLNEQLVGINKTLLEMLI